MAHYTLPPITKLVENITAVYHQATNYERTKGSVWYDLANGIAQKLSNESGYTVTQCAAVIAALSPQTSWYQNIQLAHKVLVDGEVFGIHTSDVMRKCDLIMNDWQHATDPFVMGAYVFGTKGHKTESFFHNIMGDTGVVTLDRHAIDIALGSDKPERFWITEKRYFAMAEAYMLAALQLGIQPSQLQAITWLAWRRMKGLKDDDATV